MNLKELNELIDQIKNNPEDKELFDFYIKLRKKKIQEFYGKPKNNKHKYKKTPCNHTGQNQKNKEQRKISGIKD